MLLSDVTHTVLRFLIGSKPTSTPTSGQSVLFTDDDKVVKAITDTGEILQMVPEAASIDDGKVLKNISGVLVYAPEAGGPPGPPGLRGPAGESTSNAKLIELMAKIGSKIGAAKANTLGRPLNILMIGDSLTEGMGDANTYPDVQRWAARLQQWCDIATGRPMGRGMIPGTTYSNPLNKFIVDTGTTYTETTPWTRSGSLGIYFGYGSSTMLTQINGATATFEFFGTGIAIQVPTLDPSVAGALTITIDGVEYGNLSLAYNGSSWKPKIQAYTELANGPHTLVMTSVVSAGQFAGYNGVLELTGNNGVWIHTLGVGGTTSIGWAGSFVLNETALDTIDSLITYLGTVDLVFLMLGGNDILQGIAKADFLTYMTTIVTHFAMLGIPVVGWGGGTFDETSPDIPDGFNANYEDYLTSFGAICEANGGAFLNFFKAIHGGSLWTKAFWDVSGMNGDVLHYNPAGHTYQAELFAAQQPFRDLLTVPTPTIITYSAALASDVACTTAGTWYDGASITLPAGTWLIHAQILMGKEAATADVMYARISTGSMHYASAQSHNPALNPHAMTMTMSVIVTLASPTTIKLQGASSVDYALIKAALMANEAGNNATQINATKIS